MFFPFLYGYHNDEKRLVMERFFGYSVKQHALGSIQNDWIKRITEISKALMFLHSREILHLDIQAMFWPHPILQSLLTSVEQR